MNFEKRLVKVLSRKPKLGRSVHIAKGAIVAGNVTLGAFSNVWFNAVLRGDVNRIIIGHHTNIQDNCVVHLSDDAPCKVGNYVTVGHAAILHACTIEDEVLVGMGSIILDGVRVGRQCLIGARALITQGTKIPSGSMVLGAPAKVVRKLTAAERKSLKGFAEKYVSIAAAYSRNRFPSCETDMI